MQESEFHGKYVWDTVGVLIENNHSKTHMLFISLESHTVVCYKLRLQCHDYSVTLVKQFDVDALVGRAGSVAGQVLLASFPRLSCGMPSP
jgi:hypothetical protein